MRDGRKLDVPGQLFALPFRHAWKRDFANMDSWFRATMQAYVQKYIIEAGEGGLFIFRLCW